VSVCKGELEFAAERSLAGPRSEARMIGSSVAADSCTRVTVIQDKTRTILARKASSKWSRFSYANGLAGSIAFLDANGLAGSIAFPNAGAVQLGDDAGIIVDACEPNAWDWASASDSATSIPTNLASTR
jgi:hypothetical protein